MLSNFAPSHFLVALLPDGLDPKEWYFHPFFTVSKVGYSDLTLWKNELEHFSKNEISSPDPVEQVCLTNFVLNITSAHFAIIFNFYYLFGCRVSPVQNFCRESCNSNAHFYPNTTRGLSKLACKFGPRVSPGLGEIDKKHGFRGGSDTLKKGQSGDPNSTSRWDGPKSCT